MNTTLVTSERSARRNAQMGIEDVSNTVTLYRPVISNVTLGAQTLEIANPFAHLAMLCDRHRQLFNVILDGNQHRSRKLIMYIDEIRLGN